MKRQIMRKVMSFIVALAMVFSQLSSAIVFADTGTTHYLAFASDRHSNESAIASAMSTFNSSTEYVGLIGDMVNNTNSYNTSTVQSEVTALFSGATVNIVWGTHDQNATDDAGIMYGSTAGSSKQIYAGPDGNDSDSDPDYYVYGVAYYDMSSADNASTAAATFESWVDNIDKSIPIFVVCHMPMHAQRNDNNGGYIWTKALNYAATGSETGTEITRNVVYMHGHNHTTESNQEYYYAPGSSVTMESNGSDVSATIEFTYLTAGYLNANSHATQVTLTDDTISFNRSGTALGSVTRVESSGTDTEETGTTQTVSLTKGGTASYTVSDDLTSADTSAIDTSVATVAVTANSSSSSSSVSKASSVTANGEYYISDGTNYVVMSSGTISSTTDVSEATLFTASAASSFKLSADGYYLYKNQSGLSGNTSSSTSWTYSTDTGLSYTSSSSSGGTKYLYYDDEWTTASSVDSYAYLYEASSTEETEGSTITFTGVAAGTTSVTIGDVTYKITVTDSSSSETTTQEVSLTTGGTASYTVSDDLSSADTSAIDTSVATVALTASSSSVSKATSVTANGTYYISDGTNYVVMSSGTVSSTTDVSEATLFTASAASSFKLSADGYYLYKNQSGLSGNTSSSTSWTYSTDTGLSYTSQSSSGGTKYLYYDDEWTTASSTDSYAYLYTAGSSTDGTTITFTGVAAGTTSVTIGDVTYNVTVTDSSSSETTTTTEEVSLTAGGTASYTVSGDLSSADTSAIDTSVATVALTANSSSSESTVTKATSVTANGTYYVSDGTNYIVLSSGTVSNTTDVSSATAFTASASSSFTLKADGYYLYKNQSGLSGNTSSSTSWTYSTDTGLSYTSQSSTGGTKYLTYSDSSWTSDTSVDSYAYLYEASDTADTTTTITFTGVAAGTTSVTIGDVTYDITVTASTTTTHNLTLVPAVAATCTEAGNSAYYTCSDCDKIFSDAAGTTETTLEDVTIAALGHTAVEHAAVAATCTATGTKAYYECSVCNKYFTDADCTTETTLDALTVAATGHTYDDGTVTTAATCVAKGVKTYTCTVCGETKTEEIAIDSTNHTNTVVKNAVEATCGADGYTGDTYCADCGTLIAEGTVIDAAGSHTWDEGTVTIAATCTEPGVIVYTCEVCGSTNTDEIEALGHVYEGVVTTAATCTSEGVMTYTCSRCDESYTEAIAKVSHTLVKHEAVAATCTSTGTKAYYECSVCGKYFTDANGTNETTLDALTVPAIAHTYTAVVTDPTCTTKGYTTYTCSVCGNSYVADETAALGHSYESVVTKAATCTEKGVKTYTCTVCGDSYTEDIAIDADNHVGTITQTVVEPTCTVKGYTLNTCSACGNSYKDNYTSALGHDYTTDSVAVETVANTSKKSDGKYFMTCSVCGEAKATSTKSYYASSVTLSKTSYVYSGYANLPKATVKDHKGNTLSSKFYTVKYSNDINVGTATVTVIMKNGYSGTLKKTFKIVPKGTSLTSVTAASKAFTAKWTKQTTQTTGYQICYSTSSKFTSPKYITVSGNTKTSYKKTKLSKKKTYYVRIRTYKTVSGTKYYSSWSTAKKVKTK